MCKTVTKQISVSGWNINGVYRKTSGAKANNIHDDEFQKIKKSDVFFCLKLTLAIVIFYFLMVIKVL